jgi:hypothetical protein
MVANVPLISVVILNYNGKEFLDDCIDSVLKSDYPNLEVILADNASTDGSLEIAQAKFGKDSRFKIIKNIQNLLFAGGNNAGIRAAKGEYVAILNNDTEVDKDWLKEIVSIMEDRLIGACQPKILIHNAQPPRIDYAGAGMDRFGFTCGFGRGELDEGQLDQVKDIFYAGGTAMVLRKEAIRKVGMFDERFGMHWEDTDLSWRLRLKGYKIVLAHKAVVYHKGSKTMAKFARRAEVSRYIRKNRIAGLIKNYGCLNLIKVMPGILLIYIFMTIKELLIDHDVRLSLSSFWAILWNMKALPYLLRQRRCVQNEIRCIPDREIIRFMQKELLVFKFLKERHV